MVIWGYNLFFCSSAALRLAATPPFAAAETHPIVAAGDEGWEEAREGTGAYCARAFGIGQAAALRGRVSSTPLPP
jgi:hypothetical protein